MYCSHLLEDKALLASNRDELLLWLPDRLKMFKASSRNKILTHRIIFRLFAAFFTGLIVVDIVTSVYGI